ncbi:MAG: DUF4091 domain-containing protein [Candidatus Omnitrophica bacterium]|nr:DUF4091 domain-containing protein [Candidatus Omnitrophota bacterium]
MNVIKLLKLAFVAAHAGVIGLVILRAWSLSLAESRAVAGRFLRVALTRLLLVVMVELSPYVYARFVEPNMVVVTRLRVAQDQLAHALGGRRVVQITDLHITTIGARERRLIQRVNRQRPDWIVITGDLINDAAGWRAALEVIGRLKATQGIWVVPGNTDNAILSPDSFAQGLAGVNAKVLRNSRIRMAETDAWLVGVDDPVERRDSLDEALKGMDRSAPPPMILLAHSPDILDAAVAARIPLVLVGHTHGGQLGIPWLRRLSSYADRGPYVGGGRYHVEQTTMYVNRGIGWKEIPHRFLAPPEVLVIEFRPQGKRAAPTAESPPVRAEVWLSDFERDGEEAVLWNVFNAFATHSREHASHGQACAKVTLKAGFSSSYALEDDFLTRDPARRDWTRDEALAFDVYNAQSVPEPLIVRIRDDGKGLYEETITLPSRVPHTVTLSLADLSRSLDLSRVSGLALLRKDSTHDVVLYLDAVRLLPRRAGAPASGVSTGAATEEPSALEDAAVTPHMLGRWHFEHDLVSRWRAADPATGRSVVRVPLTVVGPQMPLSVGQPIAGGIPFAMGQLAANAAIRVHDMNGAVWPAQTRPLAVWEDGSVKWLLVTAQVPMTARSRQLWLEYGEPVAADPAPQPRVRVDDTPQAVTVTTGPLRFTVSRRHFTLFDSTFVDRNRDGVFAEAERLASAGDLVLKRGDTEFRSSRDTVSYMLQVEEAGPVRATLKASGWFRDAAGRGFCQFTVRLQAFAGLPQVRVYHTFIYTGYPANLYNPNYEGIKLPANETIQDISLELPVTLGATTQLITADEQGLVTAPLTNPTSISQLAHDAYQIRQQGAASPLRAGAHHEGWLLMQDSNAGVMVGVRDAWQQYPKAFEVDAASRRLIVRLWPSSAGDLNLETGADAYGPDAVARGSAFGLAKTHELWVGFLGAVIDGSTARALAGLWQEPWLLSAHPAWVQDTDALGTVGPAEMDRFPEQEAMLEDVFGWAKRQPQRFDWYGMLDYGDTRTWYRKDAYDKSYDDWGWHPEGRWGWHNCEAVGSHGGALMSFLRTQELKYFRFGEAKARHVMDVDTVHYDTIANDSRLSRKLSDEFSKVGSMHRHNAYHWGGRNEEATHTNVAGLLLYYYLTGYERALDVAKEAGGFMLFDPVTYTKHPDIAPSRAIGNVLWNDTLLFEATGERRYRTAAERWVRVLLKGQQKDGTWLETYNPRNGTWYGDVKTNYLCYHVLPALIAYHRLTGNPAVAQAIVMGTNAMIAKEPYLQFFDALAYSFLITGKGEYVDEGLRRAMALYRSQRRDEDPAFNGTVFEKATYDRVGPILYSVPFAIGAMDATDFPTLEQSFQPPSRPTSTPPRSTQTSQQASPTATAQTGASYEVLVVPSMEKVFPQDQRPASAHSNPAVLALARNEYESVQLVLRASAPLEQVTVETHDLTRTDGTGVIPRDALTWFPVGFVKTRQPDYDVSRVGWWPDPLLDPTPFAVQAGWWQPMWLTVYAAPGTPAGEYTGTVTIRPGNAPPKDVEVKVRVWDFDLPATPTLKSAFDVYPARIDSAYRQFFPQWWPRVQGRTAQLTQWIDDDLLRHRLAPMLNADLQRPETMSELRRLRAKGLSAFAIGRYSGSFDNNWPTDGTQLEQLQPVYRAYGYQLRDAKLIDRHYIYTYDEPAPGLPHVAAVAHMVHDADPQLKNLVTLGAPMDVTALAGWLKDIDIVCLRNVIAQSESIRALQQMGKEVWLYVSGPKPPYPTLVIDYPSLAYRILPWMCWKYGIRGLLYWSVNYWTTNPYEQPMNTPWQQNGNGSLYYPGPEGPRPSLRLEVLRDGMEDYEYLSRLRELIQSAKAGGRIDAATLARAEQLVNVNDGFVESLRVYSNDPAVLLAQRQAIAEMIEKLQNILKGQGA